VVDEAEQLAIDRLKQVLILNMQTMQPRSGAQANAAVMLAIFTTGDAILGLDFKHGRASHTWRFCKL